MSLLCPTLLSVVNLKYWIDLEDGVVATMKMSCLFLKETIWSLSVMKRNVTRNDAHIAPYTNNRLRCLTSLAQPLAEYFELSYPSRFDPSVDY